MADQFGALMSIVDGGDSPTSSSSSPSDNDDDSDFMTSSDGVSVIRLGTTSDEVTSSDEDEVSLVVSDDSEASEDGGGMTGGGTSTRGRAARRKARQDAENEVNVGVVRGGQKGLRAPQRPSLRATDLCRGQSGSFGDEAGVGRIRGGRRKTRKGRGAKKASEEEEEDAKEAQGGAHVRPPGLRLRPRPVVRYGEEESSDEAGRGPVRTARTRRPSAGVGGSGAAARRGGSRIRGTATTAASHEAPQLRQGRSYAHQRDPSYSQRGLRDYNGRLKRGDSEVEDCEAGGPGRNADDDDAGGARPSRQSLRLRCVTVVGYRLLCVRVEQWQ